MGENDKLGFTCEEVPFDFSTFNRFLGAITPFVENESSVTIPWNGNHWGRITLADTDLIQRNARLKSEQECIAEKHKQIADKMMREIYESSQNAPLLFTNPTTRKARKHYKPKFTL